MAELKVWSKFSSTNTAGDTVHLKIVEMPEYLAEDVIEQFINYFVKEESTFKASGVPNNVEAMNEVRNFLLKTTKEDQFHIIVCCPDNKDEKINKIVGVSFMEFATKEKPESELPNPETEELKKLSEILKGMTSHYDETKELKLDRSFLDRGLFVHPDYRGRGIAQEIFKARRLICKEYGVPIHGAWMTSYGTQKAAERDGWETVCEVDYHSFGKAHGVEFKNAPPSSKFMIARIS